MIRDDSFINWQDDTGINGENPAKLTNGKLAEKKVDGKNCLYLSQSGSGTFFHGGMKSKILPADSGGVVGAKNFYCNFNTWFETGVMGQTGCMNINFLDEKDRS